MLRNWLLTACVRLKRRQKTMPPALRSILYCPWQDLPLQCGLLACSRWCLGNPASASTAPNRRILAMLLFDMLRAQCQHADLSSDIRTPPIWSSTISEVDLITKNSQIDWQECNNWTGKRSWHLEQMVAWCCLGPSTLLLLQQKKRLSVT